MAANLMPTDRLSTVDEHVERIVESLVPLHPYDQPLLEALGLPVCESISAPMDLPSFDNSAMDGYAVYYDDVVSASLGPPGAPAGGRRDGRGADQALRALARAPRCGS